MPTQVYPPTPNPCTCTSQQCKDREKLLAKVMEQLNLISSWLIAKYGNQESFPPDLKNILKDPRRIEEEEPIPTLVLVQNTPDPNPTSVDQIVKDELCTNSLCTSSSCTLHCNQELENDDVEYSDAGSNFGTIVLQNVVPAVKPCSVKLVRLSASDLCRTKPKTKIPRPEIQHKCDHCPKTFRKPAHLRVHRMSHTGETQYTCEKCGRKFIQLACYKTHLRRHNGDKPYKCPDPSCTKAFTNNTDLRKHKLIHSGERKFKCDLCPRAFQSRTHLKIHQVATHSLKAPFTCEVCGKGFQIKQALEIHERTHTSETPFECQEEGCSKKFKNKQTLKNHQLTKHADTRIKHHKCETCGKILYDKFRLQQHQSVHTKEFNWTCEHCGKSFTQKKYLESHARVIHNPSREAGKSWKPFQCEVCPASYTYKKDLVAHNKTKHSDRKDKEKEAKIIVSNNNSNEK